MNKSNMNRAQLLFSAILTIGALFWGQSAAGGSSQSDKLQVLYSAHQWFELRDEVQKKPAPLFYQGVVEAVFNDSVLAEKHLQQVINAAPKSEAAYRAHDLLTSLYLRSGKYQAAFLQNAQMLRLRPNQNDSQMMNGLLTILEKYPNQRVIKRVPSKIRARIYNGNLFLPLKIGSQSAEFIVDTAASLSTISESEAKRLGLKIYEPSATALTATGGQLDIRIALATQVAIGNLHLTNVAFIVAPDEQPPFSSLQPGQRGIIGLPVLLTLQQMKWTPGGLLEISFPRALKPTRSNLCFEDIGLVTEARVEQKRIRIILDTGATHSQLWPLFTKYFPDIARKGKRENGQIIGMSGASQYPILVVPTLKIDFAGSSLNLQPAIVLLETGNDLSAWYQGEIGMDILGTHAFSLDFKTMSLAF